MIFIKTGSVEPFKNEIAVHRIFILLLFITYCSISQSAANMQFCNNLNERVYYSAAYSCGTFVWSEEWCIKGWYPIDAKSCDSWNSITTTIFMFHHPDHGNITFDFDIRNTRNFIPSSIRTYGICAHPTKGFDREVSSLSKMINCPKNWRRYYHSVGVTPGTVQSYDRFYLNYNNMDAFPGAGKTYSTFRIKNKCSERIYVAIRLRGIRCEQIGSSSCTSSTEKLWKTHKWYKLDYGESTEKLITDNRYIHVYAATKGYKTQWSGSSHYEHLGDKKRGFIKINTGENYGDYTHALTCTTK